MINNIKKVLKLFFRCEIVYILLGVFIFFVTYKPGVYLTGWDNLQTELYPYLGVKRAFFSVWQEYQSFGLLGGLAHGSDLLRSLFILFLSYFLPNDSIRYVFHILMYVLGGLGSFYLIKSLDSRKNRSSFAFLGSLFYLFNLGTIQIFSLPFESFSIFFASLPWQIWIFLKIISDDKPNFKKWGLFFLINVLATPQYYIQTIFVVNMLVLLGISLGNFAITLNFNIVKRSLIALSLIGLINSFWLAPQIYFLKNNSHIVREAKINTESTLDTFYQNQEYGNLPSIIKLEGFYFRLQDIYKKNIFSPWIAHQNKPVISLIPYFLWFICLIGVLAKKKNGLIILVPLLITIVALAGNIPPFSFINEIIRSKPIINQIFRTPFTKFIIPYALFLAYFFGAGSQKIYLILKGDVKDKRIYLYLYSILLSSLMLAFMLPIKDGNFFSSEVKIKIPIEYFKMMDYFKEKVPLDNRIALAPDYTYWGWFYNTWGYSGSGFIWYGVEQPIVSRTFDVWSQESESFFWEIKTSTEKEDVDLYESILKKYNINYLLVDYSLIPVSSSLKYKHYDQIDKILSQSKNIKEIFASGGLRLFKFEDSYSQNSYVSEINNAINSGPKISMVSYDPAFKMHDIYITDYNHDFDFYFPYKGLMSQSDIGMNDLSIKTDKEEIKIEKEISKSLISENLLYDSDFRAELFRKDHIASFEGKLNISISNNTLTASFPAILIDDFDLDSIYLEDCSDVKSPNYAKLSLRDGLLIQSENRAIPCFWFEDLSLEQRYSYLLDIDSENISGKPFYFYVIDKTDSQTQIEDQLEENKTIHIIPPKKNDGLGYGFTFYNYSYFGSKTENIIKNIKLFLFPYNNLKNTYIAKNDFIKESSLNELVVKKVNYFQYETKAKLNNQIIFLSQSFHPGWKAYYIDCQNQNFKCQISKTFPMIFGKELKNHVLVNNWANGWQLENQEGDEADSREKNIVILFWPQYLQFAGFGILVITFLALFGILIRKNKFYKIRKSEETHEKKVDENIEKDIPENKKDTDVKNEDDDEIKIYKEL